MGTLQAIALGILQGLTEFLPVSSSGHLVLAQALLRTEIDQALAFDVCLHFGTLVAILVYFRMDFVGMARSLVVRDPELAVDRRWIGLLALATVPVVIVGLAAADAISAAFHSVPLVGGALLVTAGMLWAAGNRPDGGRGAADLGVADALVIGGFQVLGIVPGISRSGSTIVGGLLMGLERETAARFAFFMAVPAIAGAMVKNAGGLGELISLGATPLIAGTLASAVTGWFAIDVMMRVVRAGRLIYFALYCLVLGGLTLAFSLSGWVWL